MRRPRSTPIAPARRTVAACAATVALLGLLAGGRGASAQSSLDSAKQRLTELEQRITSQEAALDGLRTELEDLTASVGRQEGQVDSIRRDIRRTEERQRRTASELERTKGRIRERAREVYMHGPASWLDFLFRAESFREAATRLVFASRVLSEDSDAALGMRSTKAELAEQRSQLESLVAQEQRVLRTVRGRQRDLASAVAQQQLRVVDLARARTEALALVQQLRSQLSGREIANFELVAGKGMPITFAEWAGHFLGTLGAPASRSNLVVMVAWQVAEYTKATWNPLATTYVMPGATVFNSHGVKNYRSMEQGIQASIGTLRLPSRGYEPVLASLARGAPAMETAEAINASLWCRGCAGGNYVTGLIEAVEQSYDRYASS